MIKYTNLVRSVEIYLIILFKWIKHIFILNYPSSFYYMYTLTIFAQQNNHLETLDFRFLTRKSTTVELTELCYC